MDHGARDRQGLDVIPRGLMVKRFNKIAARAADDHKQDARHVEVCRA